MESLKARLHQELLGGGLVHDLAKRVKANLMKVKGEPVIRGGASIASAATCERVPWYVPTVPRES